MPACLALPVMLCHPPSASARCALPDFGGGLGKDARIIRSYTDVRAVLLATEQFRIRWHFGVSLCLLETQVCLGPNTPSRDIEPPVMFDQGAR